MYRRNQRDGNPIYTFAWLYEQVQQEVDRQRLEKAREGTQRRIDLITSPSAKQPTAFSSEKSAKHKDEPSDAYAGKAKGKGKGKGKGGKGNGMPTPPGGGPTPKAKAKATAINRSKSSSSSESGRIPLTPDEKKRRACWFFMRDKCSKGDACEFSHNKQIVDAARAKASGKGRSKANSATESDSGESTDSGKESRKKRRGRQNKGKKEKNETPAQAPYAAWTPIDTDADGFAAWVPLSPYCG